MAKQAYSLSLSLHIEAYSHRTLTLSINQYCPEFHCLRAHILLCTLSLIDLVIFLFLPIGWKYSDNQYILRALLFCILGMGH